MINRRHAWLLDRRGQLALESVGNVSVHFASHLASDLHHLRTTPRMAQRRLTRLLQELAQPPPTIGTLSLGEIAFDVHASVSPTRLPHSDNTLLDAEDTFNANNLHFILQKYLLGQDVFLLSQPGPYARRLAMTFCR